MFIGLFYYIHYIYVMFFLDLLASVGALTLTNPNKLISYLSWTAPFTLNLQISPPFILYCIDAWNTRGLPMQYAKLVYSVCNMENTSFSFNSSYLELSSCDTLIFTITPVNLAGNGTSASIEGAPLNYTEGMIIKKLSIINYNIST